MRKVGPPCAVIRRGASPPVATLVSRLCWLGPFPLVREDVGEGDSLAIGGVVGVQVRPRRATLHVLDNGVVD